MYLRVKFILTDKTEDFLLPGSVNRSAEVSRALYQHRQDPYSLSYLGNNRKRNIRSKPWQRYLGVSVTGGNCRNDHVIRHRFNKTKDRRKRNAQIAKTHKGARRLFNASSFTATSWGNPASGLSHSHLLELERSGVRCSGIKPQGKCRFTACIVAYGQYHHPIARILRELFKTWFLCLATVFIDSPKLFPDLRVAWKKWLRK